MFELGFSEGILPIIESIRKAIQEKELILTVHPQSCSGEMMPLRCSGFGGERAISALQNQFSRGPRDSDDIRL